MEPGGQVGGEVIVWGPVLELHQHGLARLVNHSGRQILKAVPKLFQLDPGNDFVGPGVDNVVLDVTKLLPKGLGAPQILHVQLLRDVGHNYGLTSDPLFLEMGFSDQSWNIAPD